jgi:hypothetical protein
MVNELHNIMTYLGITVDGIWIYDYIYWQLIHSTRNYK